MANDLLAIAALLWIAGAILALVRGGACAGASGCSSLGGLAAIAAAAITLPEPARRPRLPLAHGRRGDLFRLTPEALWLLGFGLVPAAPGCWLGTPRAPAAAAWCFGAALSLLGALGVFGLQHARLLLCCPGS